MANDQNEKKPENAGEEVRRLPAKQAPEHVVPTYKDVPETVRPERRPGPRKRFPQVPRGPERPDETPNGPVPPRKHAMATPAMAGIKVLNNVELSAITASSTTSSVGEPSCATNGNVVFYTGNWYAAMSIDGGNSFEYLNPFNTFPDPPRMGFCCDQVVQYIPSIDMFVWLLQYTQDNNNENVERIAFASTADMAAKRWKTYDISPTDLGLPLMMLDFPDLGVGTNYLYVTCNAFDATGAWTAAVILRIPLSSLATGAPSAEIWPTNQNFALRCAQHCGTTAYFAAHQNTSTLRVFTWTETAAAPAITDVPVPTWGDAPFVSKTPDNFNWLARADSRILGAAAFESQLWFGWGANAGGANQRPNPYVQIAKLNTVNGNITLTDSINLWDPAAAIQYAAIDSTIDGDVGVAYFFGGNNAYPSPAIAFLPDTSDHVVTVSGSFGPSKEVWGDYLTIRRSPDGRRLSATGYIQKTGSDDVNVAPRYVVFSR